MKQLLISFIVLLSMSVSAQNIEQNQESFDTMSREQKEKELYIVEHVDSLRREGMYMHALEVLDSLQADWAKTTGMKPTPLMYMTKGQIYMCLEEWQELIDVTAVCVNQNKETMTDEMAAIIYSMQGIGYRQLEDYKNAIRSYEYAVSYYSKVGNYGSQGDMLCCIAYSYDKLGKPFAASSFYQKGFMKFLEYFNITKKQLLQSSLKEDDSYKEKVMRIFAVHLYNMAKYEHDNGDHQASKEYLLMSAHCGYSKAKSEYQRIYGRIK